jgi:acetyl-CoA carboxylase biotin carboxyl carrier protein
VTLTSADVARIMELVEQSAFDELTLEVDGFKLHVARRGAGSGAAASSPAPAAAPAAVTRPAPAAAAAAPASSAAGSAAPAAPAAAHADDLPAPLLGTFYRSPKPGAPPFVEVGSTVEADTVVAIIEVMKLMTTVRAGRRGVVTDILVADGTLVEYGQPILRIRGEG